MRCQPITFPHAYRHLHWPVLPSISTCSLGPSDPFPHSLLFFFSQAQSLIALFLHFDSLQLPGLSLYHPPVFPSESLRATCSVSGQALFISCQYLSLLFLIKFQSHVSFRSCAVQLLPAFFLVAFHLSMPISLPTLCTLPPSPHQVLTHSFHLLFPSRAFSKPVHVQLISQ